MLRATAYFLPLLLAEIVAAFACWERFAERGGKLTYQITDIWALMLGLTPTFLVAAHAARLMELGLSSYWPAEYMLALAIVLALSQLAGAFAGRLAHRPPPVKREHLGRLKSAVCILAGASGGLAVFVLYILILNALGRPY